MLLLAERGEAGEVLRIWESDQVFVSVGLGARVSEEVFLDRCIENAIPIVRRASGGGSVLQGPGCLNYTVVLSKKSLPELQGIRSSFSYVLSRILAALAGAGIGLKQSGLSDLAISGCKVSGNAQQRKRDFFLQHGTLLYDFDLRQMGRYLKEPPRAPAYRRGRSHAEFVRNLCVSPPFIQQAVCSAFGVDPRDCSRFPSRGELECVRSLVEDKYGRDAWTFRR